MTTDVANKTREAASVEALKEPLMKAIVSLVERALRDAEQLNAALHRAAEAQAAAASEQRSFSDITVSLSSEEVSILTRMLGIATQQGADEDRAKARVLYCRIVNESNRKYSERLGLTEKL